MNRTWLRMKLPGFVLRRGVCGLAAFSLLATLTARCAQNPAPPVKRTAISSSAAASGQTVPQDATPKKVAGKTNLDKTKTDAARLSALADELRNELDKMNVNVFSIDVIQKTQELEKLARKIRNEANEL